jgi:hypothetical protein
LPIGAPAVKQMAALRGWQFARLAPAGRGLRAEHNVRQRADRCHKIGRPESESSERTIHPGPDRAAGVTVDGIRSGIFRMGVHQQGEDGGLQLPGKVVQERMGRDRAAGVATGTCAPH